MKSIIYIILKVPGLLLMFFGLYLKFRGARKSYLRHFNKTISSTSMNEGAAERIIEVQKELMEIHFVKFVRIISGESLH